MKIINYNKDDDNKSVVEKYKGCGHKEYYGMIYSRSGFQFCRKCIYEIWQKENPEWQPSTTDYVFPIYEDGVNYYEQDSKEWKNNSI